MTAEREPDVSEYYQTPSNSLPCVTFHLTESQEENMRVGWDPEGGGSLQI